MGVGASRARRESATLALCDGRQRRTGGLVAGGSTVRLAALAALAAQDRALTRLWSRRARVVVLAPRWPLLGPRRVEQKGFVEIEIRLERRR